MKWKFWKRSGSRNKKSGEAPSHEKVTYDPDVGEVVERGLADDDDARESRDDDDVLKGDLEDDDVDGEDVDSGDGEGDSTEAEEVLFAGVGAELEECSEILAKVNEDIEDNLEDLDLDELEMYDELGLDGVEELSNEASVNTDDEDGGDEETLDDVSRRLQDELTIGVVNFDDLDDPKVDIYEAMRREYQRQEVDGNRDALESQASKITRYTDSDLAAAVTAAAEKLHTRGEELGALDEKTGEMADRAGEFRKTATEFRQQMEKKRWYNP